MQKDRTEKYLEAYPDVFADIVNVLLFKEPLIKAEELRDGPTEAVYKAEKGETVLEQRRDIAKYVVKDGRECALIGLENQTNPDGDMVFRMMNYDSASYQSQIRCGVHRYPVISAVLYFGEKPWGKRRRMNDSYTHAVQCQGELLPDYKMHLIEVCSIPKETREKLTSDFRVVADFFSNRKQKKYIPDNRILQHPEAVLHLIAVFAGDERYHEIEAEVAACCRKGESFSMCEFAERMERQGINKGISQGISIGRKQGIEEKMRTVVKNMIQRGIEDSDICAIAGCNQEFVDSIRKRM